MRTLPHDPPRRLPPSRCPAMTPRILTFAEAAEILKISAKTLRRLIVSGQLRAGKLGATWRVRSDDLDAFMEKLTCPSTSAATSGTSIGNYIFDSPIIPG